MAALPDGETFSEQMWVVYFALSIKDQNLSQITEDTWIEIYSKKGSNKFDRFLKEKNIEWCVKNMPIDSRFNRADLDSAKKKFLSKKNYDDGLG